MHPVSYDVDIRHDLVCGCTCESKRVKSEIDLKWFACFCDKIKIKNGLWDSFTESLLKLFLDGKVVCLLCKMSVRFLRRSLVCLEKLNWTISDAQAKEGLMEFVKLTKYVLLFFL